MNTQQQIVSEETSSNVGHMPIDLLIEIFSRLPSKSVARCRCISKPWDSLLRLPSFTELFLTRSSTRPRLLFSCRNGRTVSLFSSTQPRILNDNLSLLTANYHMTIPYNAYERFIPSGGLVFLSYNGDYGKVYVVSNPSTGQYLTLPEVKTKRSTRVVSYFGYDPVKKQHKVLFMTWKSNNYDIDLLDRQVLTLGTPKPRKIKCSLVHYAANLYCHICINGVLYYTAYNSSREIIIVCFDVKSEKFTFTKCMQIVVTGFYGNPLVNYNGKLGCLESSSLFSRIDTSISLWVLEDVEKQEWFKYTFVLPALWPNIVGELCLCLVGMTQTKEIVFSVYSGYTPYYIFFYDIKRETITRVEIQGMETVKSRKIYTYLDHIEDVKLMHMF